MGRGKAIWTSVLVLFGILVPPVSAGQEFPIDRIEILGRQRISEALLLSELGIQPGKSYSERDLERAEQRLRRLPFILETMFFLKKGSQYGSYLLEVEIKEAHLSFFRFSRRWGEKSSELLPGTEHIDFFDQRQQQFGDLDLGLRWFFGKYVFAYGSLNIEERHGEFRLNKRNPYNLGLVHYNLFGKRVFAHLNLQVENDEARSGAFSGFPTTEGVDEGQIAVDREPSPSLTLAVPLAANRWLIGDVDYFRESQVFTFSGAQLRTDDAVEDQRLKMSLRWLLDSLDRADLPTRGYRLDLGFETVFLESKQQSTVSELIVIDSVLSVNQSSFRIFSFDSDVRFLRSSGVFYNPFWVNSSFFVQGAFRKRIGGDVDLLRGAVSEMFQFEGGVVKDLFGDLSLNRLGKWRLSLSVAHGEEQFDRFEGRLTRWALGLQIRNPWGQVKFEFLKEDRRTIDLGMGTP